MEAWFSNYSQQQLLIKKLKYYDEYAVAVWQSSEFVRVNTEYIKDEIKPAQETPELATNKTLVENSTDIQIDELN